MEQAEEFNGQFTDMFNKSDHSEVPFLSMSPPFMDDVVSKEGVTKLLKSFNPSEAVKGPDDLQPSVLKELATFMGPGFAISSKSLLTRVKSPKNCCLQIFVPSVKRVTGLPCNYHPVSLTCVLCKLLKHIVCLNIMALLDEY